MFDLFQDLFDVLRLGRRIGRGDVADVQDQVGLAHFLQGRAEALDQFVRQVGDEAHGVGDDGGAALRQADGALGGVQRGEQQVLGQDLRARQPVEQGRLAGVGIADQGDRGERGLLPLFPVQAAGAADLLQLALQLDDAVGDQAAVELDLGLAGAAGRAGAAALALQVGPGADQAGFLIVEPRQFDLQPALLRPRAAAEDLENEPGAVDDLAVPFLFQIALLDRRQVVVDDGGFGFGGADQGSQFLDLAGAEQGRGRGLAQAHDLLGADVEVQRAGEARGLLEPFQCRAGRSLAHVGMDDDRPDERHGMVDEFGGQGVSEWRVVSGECRGA